MVSTAVTFDETFDDQMQQLQTAIEARAAAILASSTEGSSTSLLDAPTAARAVTSDMFEMTEILHETFPAMSLDQRRVLYKRFLADHGGSDDGGGNSAAPVASPFPMPRVASMRNALAASGMRPPPSSAADSLLLRSTSSLLPSSPPPGAAATAAATAADLLGGRRQPIRLSADPFILMAKRCPCERVPSMPSHPRRPAAPSSLDGSFGSDAQLPTSGDASTTPTRAATVAHVTMLDGAWKQYLRGEDVLTRGQVGDEWEAAIEHFEQSAHLFEREGDWCMAANALVRCADCLRCLFNTDAMASYLDRAAHLYIRYTASAAGLTGDAPDANLSLVSDAAVQAAMQAVYVALAAGRKAKAAKFCRRGAEIAVDANQHDVAVSFLHRAKDLYAELHLLGDARAAMARAVAICVMDMSDPASAIDTLEKFADVSIPEEQPLVLFRAMICRLACIPDVVGNDTNEAMIDCEYCLDQYTDLCVALCGGKENACLKQMLRGILEHSPQRIQNAIESYVACHTLEAWVEPVMHVVWERAIQRLAHQTERTREIPWGPSEPFLGQ